MRKFLSLPETIRLQDLLNSAHSRIEKKIKRITILYDQILETTYQRHSKQNLLCNFQVHYQYDLGCIELNAMTSAGNSVNMKYVCLNKLDKAVYSSFPTFITDITGK